MPFQYQPFVNPYVSSMSDLMGRGVEARSRAELTAAEAQAGAQRRLGDITGAQWSGLGNTIGQGIDAYVTEQREAPIRKHAALLRADQLKQVAERAEGRERQQQAQALLGRVLTGRDVRGTPAGDMLAFQTDADGGLTRTDLAPDPSAEPGLLPAQTLTMDRDPYGVQQGGIRLFNVEKYIQEAAAGEVLPESAEYISMMRELNTDKINQVQQGLKRAQTQGNQLIAMGNEGILNAGAAMIAHWKDTVPETYLRPLEMALEAGKPDEFRRVLRGFTGLQPSFVSAEPGQQMLETTAGAYSKVPGQRQFTPGTPASLIQNEIAIKEKELGRPLTLAEKNDIETRIAATAQPQRAAYYTMGDAYDAQGRPIGSIILDSRTGKTQFVTARELGAYPARPPGNLAQRTIENEAALDSLGRLEQMFTAGAEEDIGPAEGRMRQFAQSFPSGVGVMTLFGADTERFANFEAATRGFQNAMIKAITGAQMSEPEAKRIMGQIPAVEDNPVVWAAKYDQSVVNLKDLEFRLRSDRDAGRDELAPALDAEGRPIDYGAIFREATGLDIEEDDGLGDAYGLYKSLGDPR